MEVFAASFINAFLRAKIIKDAQKTTLLYLDNRWTCLYCDRINNMDRLEFRCSGCGAPKENNVRKL